MPAENEMTTPATPTRWQPPGDEAAATGSTPAARAAATSPRLRPSWWQWPTVLSLDAPAISMAWLVLLARSSGIDPGWAPVFVLGASVWLAYVADRSIEGWRLPPEDVRTPRHAFYQRWRWPVTVVWGAVLACDVGVALVHVPHARLVAGGVLTAAVAAYLLSHQLIHRERRWRVPKEICIAGLLTAGPALFLVDVARPGALAAPLALFAGICFVNCALISSWEQDVDRIHRQSSLALESSHAAWIPWTPWILAGVAAAAAMAGSVGLGIAGCAMASAIGMGAIDRFEPALGWPLARVLADGALLTPLVPLWFPA